MERIGRLRFDASLIAVEKHKSEDGKETKYSRRKFPMAHFFFGGFLRER
jgi:hypothetical protein